MLFVELLNNYKIYQKNARLIENGLLSKKINIKQRDQLNIDNNKWFETCNHKGLLFIENNKYYFVTRTSINNKLELPNNYQSMQVSGRQLAQPIVVNNICNIMNKKWLLGDEHTNKVEYKSLEDKPLIVANLIGTNDDLSNLKILVKKLDLKEYYISPYFNIEKTIDELALFNIGKIVNTIRDE